MQQHSNVGILMRYITKVGWFVRGEQGDMGKCDFKLESQG
jgi:hypothetical protein